MARTVRDSKLETRTARLQLRVRSKPYFRAIDHGLHLGYRKGKTAGRWLVRYYRGAGVYKVEPLGTADDVQDADGTGIAVLSYREAQARAREVFAQRTRQAAGIEEPAGPYTVEKCLDDYLSWMEVHRKSAIDSRIRAEAQIIPKIGQIDTAELTSGIIKQWHEDLATAPARLRTKSGKKQNYRPAPEDDEGIRRRRSTANRIFSILRAALNQGFENSKIASDHAWRRVKPFRGTEGVRKRYLTVDEGTRLINACDPDFRPLAQAALLTGARYGELIALDVTDFNLDSGTVHVRASKGGKDRHIVLNDEGVALFTALTDGRPSAAPMFIRADGLRWGRAHQRRPMKAACERAGIHPAAGFHVLRHTWASLTVMAGAPLIVVAENLGHVDTKMVEKHYGHLAKSYVADTIRATAPRFGTMKESNVTRMSRRAKA